MKRIYDARKRIKSVAIERQILLGQLLLTG